MAQQTLSNGPTMDGNHLKTEINNQESQPGKLTPEPPIVTPSPPNPNGPFLVRPPLSRSDSRQNFQYRPPFSPQTFVNSGPQSLSPQVLSGYQPSSPLNSGPQSLSPQPLSGYHPSSPVNSGPQSIGPQYLSGPQIRPGVNRPPVANQPFVQRGPPLGPGGTRLPQGNNSPQQQQRPVFRPQSPFQRPPLLGQRPQVYQQSSVPAYRPRTNLEDSLSSLNRSQTLDSSELENPNIADDGRRLSVDQRPPSAASLARSFSTSPNQSQSSMENVFKKEEVVTSRPESRSGSRMDKIVENDVKIERNPSENRGDIINGELTTKSSEIDSSNYIIHNSAPPKQDLQEEAKKKDNMELKLANFNKGDNDSGVDESTQGNDQSCNGDSRTLRKPPKSRTSSSTPTKARSMSRGSKTPSSLQSPDSAATTPGSADKKKVPMNKIQVGSAPSPNLKVVKSKIGSLDNATYKPGGGKVKIEHKKLDFKNAGSRIEAKNDKYVPKGGEKKEVQSARGSRTVTAPTRIISQKLEWNARSKIGSLENAAYKPKGGDKKIESVKLNFKDKAAPKVGSKDNIKHQPGGGDVKIENRKIELHASSKVGSMDNVKHKPTGGDKKIFDDKDYLKQSGKSSMDQSLSGSQAYEEIEYTLIKPATKNMNSPIDVTRRILDTLNEEEICNFSRRFTRSGSTRRKVTTPRGNESSKPQWRF
ncbi:unnamed protein product [Ceutorhynchus assimilis]|uniref:Microtubule-associated protein n=1 Tax=Ceutorhynchus assimilis TaxID=467358 RepID=A0A9N9QEB7_9CUCU|nr:unnamed protein product [Ceutorhynchus assimilis]